MAEHRCFPHLNAQEMVRCSSHVPEEVVEEIFSWLPPESLIRFKCVCKSWYSLITSLFNNPDFVAKHLRNANNNILSPKSLLLSDQRYPFVYYLHEKKLLLLNLFSDDGEKDQIHYVTEELELRWGERDLYHVFIGHCNGIICVHNYSNDTTILWNPALRESKVLPLSSNSWYDVGCDVDAMGFGYDPISNDYKVVLTWSNDVADIYSMNTDSWRMITKGLHGHHPRRAVMDVCYKGVCYWLLGSDNNIMLSLDLHAEEFHVLPLPGACVCRRTLTVWIDSIAYLSCSGTGRTASIEIWTRKDCLGGVDDSSCWIKYLTIRPLEGIWTQLAFWKRDELLLEGRDGGLVSYNLGTEKLRKLTFPGLYRISCWGPYVKSLVSVNRQGQA